MRFARFAESRATIGWSYPPVLGESAHSLELE
jgi:hypothetical protein